MTNEYTKNRPVSHDAVMSGTYTGGEPSQVETIAESSLSPETSTRQPIGRGKRVAMYVTGAVVALGLVVGAVAYSIERVHDSGNKGLSRCLQHGVDLIESPSRAHEEMRD